MELFPDGGFVRLQCRMTGKYVHADGDWVRVSLRPLSIQIPSLEEVWRVQHWVSTWGRVFVLLQSAAYGRYLSLSSYLEWLGLGHHPACRVIQRDFDGPDLGDPLLLMWSVERLDQNYVRLHQFNIHLRTSGTYLPWSAAIIGDVVRRRTFTPMLQWAVHAVAATPLQLPFPATPPEPQIQGGRLSLLFWVLWRRNGYGPGAYEDVSREIRHVRADDEGNFGQNWRSFITHDWAVADLTAYLGQMNLEPQDTGPHDYILCILPGSRGRLMPLVTHLPRSRDTLSLVVFRTGSPATEAFVYPQIYALAP